MAQVKESAAYTVAEPSEPLIQTLHSALYQRSTVGHVNFPANGRRPSRRLHRLRRRRRCCTSWRPARPAGRCCCWHAPWVCASGCGSSTSWPASSSTPPSSSQGIKGYTIASADQSSVVVESVNMGSLNVLYIPHLLGKKITPTDERFRLWLLLENLDNLVTDIGSINYTQNATLLSKKNLNPQHTVPTLDDNGFILWESGAILCYLAEQHAADDSWYPSEPRRRAVVHQLLYFDTATLHPRITQYFRPAVFGGARPDPCALQAVEEALGLLDKFIEGRAWAAGDSCTVADCALAVSVCNAEAFGVNLSKYPQVRKWYSRAKQEMAGFEELNQAGANTLASMIKHDAGAGADNRKP